MLPSVTRRLLGYVSGGLALALALTGAFAWLQTARLSSAQELATSLRSTIGLLRQRVNSDSQLIAVRDRLIQSQNTAVLALQKADTSNRKAYEARIASAEKVAKVQQARAADIMARQATTQDELERSREALRLIQQVVEADGSVTVPVKE
jgi:hypothetical protein